MSTVHRTRDGDWAVCDTVGRCRASKFHFPDTTIETMAAVPEDMLWAMLEIVDPPKLDDSGYRQWFDREQRFHRDYDLPAEISPQGMVSWHQRHMCHRAGGNPAVIFPHGRREWWERDRRHRADDLPAIVEENSVRCRHEWWVEGQRHRADGQPAVVDSNGERRWFEQGKAHRWGGPAVIEADGKRSFWVGGKYVPERIVALQWPSWLEA